MNPGIRLTPPIRSTSPIPYASATPQTFRHCSGYYPGIDVDLDTMHRSYDSEE